MMMIKSFSNQDTERLFFGQNPKKLPNEIWRRAITADTADTAFRLGRYFGMSAQFWLNLQTHYDLEMFTMQSGTIIEKEVKPLPSKVVAR
jgi:plasmid maintenance system antidote protein VapI